MNALALAVQVLGWCLLHFVWQAALVGVLYVAARVVLPRGNPRYLAAMVAMILLAALPILTGWHEFRVFAQQPVALGHFVVTGTSGLGSPAIAVAAPQEWLAPLRGALPWLVLAWGLGVAFLALRVARQWRRLRAIVRAAGTLPALQERARRLGQHLGLQHAVRLLVSTRVATPTLVGWLRPVVVVPIAMLARMPTEQVDLILAHELAHLRRFDHLANLFQVVVETLLFYHPVVHWISRDARNERELCCDALALQATGGRRRDFVAALAGLAEFHTGHADLALAASGGVLAERAWFIAGAPPERRHGHVGPLTIGLALLGVAIALGVAWRQDAVRERVDHVLAANEVLLRHGLAEAFADLRPQWRQDVAARRPEIAPVAMVPVAPPALKEAVPGIDVATPYVAPVLAIADVDVAPIGVAPALPVPLGRLAGTPRALRTVAPAYPRQALLEGVQGKVEVEFALSAAGVPRDLQVVESSASGRFDAAALEALSRWRFAPPDIAGRRYRQVFTFQLRDRRGAVEAAAARDCIATTGTHICRHPSEVESAVQVRRPNR